MRRNAWGIWIHTARCKNPIGVFLKLWLDHGRYAANRMHLTVYLKIGSRPNSATKVKKEIDSTVSAAVLIQPIMQSAPDTDDT